jgi:4-hydroxy-2-oxoheptanedioate aldolase
MSASTGFSLARRLRAGETVYTGWCGMGSSLVAEALAREGFVAVNLDQQHGQFDMATTAQGIGAIRLAGAAPVVRVPLGDFAVVSRVLDLGAEGVIAPMINTPADARAFVSAAKFPPVGDRSWGPMRAMMLAGMSDPKSYLHEANDLTVTMAMIETRTSLDNLDAIAATPGIDMLFVGPSDLSITLSNGTALDPHSPEIEKELDRIAAVAHKSKKFAGLFCANAERAVAYSRRGYQFLAVGTDLMQLRAGVAAQIAVLKDG